MRDAIGVVVVALLGLLAVLILNGAASPHDLRWPIRFRLRTMLVVITVVAVAMGMAVYALR